MHLPPALRTKFTYCDALIVGIVLVGEGFDSVASCLSAGESLRFLATRVWHWIALHTAGVPLILLTVSTVSEQFLTLEGFSDWVYSLCIIVALFCVAASLGAAVFFLRTLSATSDLFLFVFVVATVFCAVFAYCMMGQPSMCWRRRPKHRTTKVESMQIASKLHLSLDFGNPGGNSSSTSSSPDPCCRATVCVCIQHVFLVCRQNARVYSRRAL